jgi:tRNA(Arg) A34 adenosine deaminase TadA
MKNLVFAPPRWLRRHADKHARTRYARVDDQMRAAVELAELNVRHGTGGPFGAVVLELPTKKIVGWGVNLSVASGSIFHAEVSAIWSAQQALGRTDLAASARWRYILVSTAAPCAMCAGALVWSGVSKLIVGATSADVERIVGFDEGPLRKDIFAQFRRRGIEVRRGVLRQDCCRVLQAYVSSEGPVYGAGSRFSRNPSRLRRK